jgi:ABC-2 type transport system permease protein
MKLFLREPLAVGFTLAYPVVVMFVIAGVFNQPGEIFRRVPGAEYYVVSNLAVVTGAMGLIALPPHVAAYFERGIMRRFRASSVPVVAVIAAQVAVSLVAAVAAALVLLLAARPAYTYHAPQSLPGVLLGAAAGLAAFVGLGLLVAAVCRTSRAAQGIGLLLFFPMYLISGAGPPLFVLPSAMRRIADFDPLQYATRALQDPWFGYGITATNLIVLLGVAIASTAGAALLFRRH